MAQTEFTRNWSTVPVTGRFLNITGETVLGYLTFEPTPRRMMDARALTTVVQSFVNVRLGADGRFRLDMPATDDPDVTPIEFTYKVTEHFEGSDPFSYHIEVPLLYADVGVDISALQQVSENPGLPADITREDFDALAMQVEMLLGIVEGGSASSVYAGPGLDGGGVMVGELP
jgi:hypothetical protein